jgi:DNA-binding transcriptional LysR family regulator
MQAIVDAAEHGVGIGLVSLPVAKARLAAGTLVRLTEQELDTGENYFVLRRPEIASRTSVALVIDWLVHHFTTADTQATHESD